MSDVRATTLPADAVRITTNSDTEPFWRYAREGKLVALQCGSCGHFRMPPTPFCPECQSTEKRWKELSGRGSVYSYAVIHGFPGIPDITLVGAVVSLDGAGEARLVTNVIDVDPSEVRIGMELEVTFSPISDGWQLPVFRPARG